MGFVYSDAIDRQLTTFRHMSSMQLKYRRWCRNFIIIQLFTKFSILMNKEERERIFSFALINHHKLNGPRHFLSWEHWKEAPTSPMINVFLMPYKQHLSPLYWDFLLIIHILWNFKFKQLCLWWTIIISLLFLKLTELNNR